MKRKALVACSMLALGAPALAQDSSSEANWQRIVECAQERSESGRHACMDNVLEQAGVLDSDKRAEIAAQDKIETFGLSVVQMEQAARKAEEAQPAVPLPIPAAAPAVAAAQPPATATPAPQAPAAAPAAPPRPAPPAKLDSIETTIAQAFDPGNRLYIFVTAEGQIWQQNESKDLGLPPRPGTRFSVERGAMGGFICQFGNSRAFRCRRQG